MTIVTPTLAVAAAGIAGYLLIKTYLSKRTSIAPPDSRFLLCRDHDAYMREKLIKIDTVENWGDIYQRLKKKKTGGEKYYIYVLYMHPQRASLYEIYFNTLKRQWERNDEALPDGMYTFVLTKNWKMLAVNEQDEAFFNEFLKEKQLSSKVFFKHTTLTRGEGVFFSGMGLLTNGVFTWNGLSGHYRPKPIHVSICKTWFKTHGVANEIYVQSEKEKIRNGFKKLP